MTAARLPPLWIADQVHNDGVWDAGMTAARLPPLWIADQVRNDGFGVRE